MTPRSALLVLALLAPPPVALGGDPAADRSDEARALLEEGKAGPALEKAEEALEYAPDRPEILDLASRAAAAAGETDVALWYGALAQEAIAALESPGRVERELAAALTKRLAELDPLGGQGGTLLDGHAASILAIGKACAGRKLYVNAVDLLDRCQGTSAAAAAEDQLARIYGNKRAVEELLASGLDVPIQPKRRRSPEAIARDDAKHATWETAWEVKGKQYTIKTDMGFELAQSMSLAMEQMNAFYRKVFHIKEYGGGQTARVTISVYKSREEFDRYESDGGKPISPGVKGFFSPSENRVATYDPRTDGRSLAFLWQTLFHESSHQFTHLMAAGQVPTWLNEGTASYFEGAELQPNGRVATNLVAEERLAGLKLVLASGSPTLEELVTYFQPGSYPGAYYYPGWGLVYFLQNYEDESSRRVYLEPYQKFMEVYGKSAAKHDVLERFVETFVTKPAQPGVKTFADFEARWKAWILDLHELYFGGPEVADRLIARGRKQVEDEAPEAAEESYAWALRKRPGDPVAAFELAELLASQKRVDAAIYRYRTAIASLGAMDDPSGPLPGGGELTGADLLGLSGKALAKLDRSFDEAHGKAVAEFAAGVREAAQAYADQGLPRAAMRLLDRAAELDEGAGRLDRLRDEIAAASKVDTRRWRRPAVDADLLEWEADEGWTGGEGVLTAEAEHPSFCAWRGDLPPRYVLEATIDASGLSEESGFVGITFGDDGRRLQYVGFTSGGRAEIGKLADGWKPRGALPSIHADRLAGFTVRLEVEPGKLQVSFDGKATGKPRKASAEDLAGGIGFVVQGGSAAIRDVRLRY